MHTTFTLFSLHPKRTAPDTDELPLDEDLEADAPDASDEDSEPTAEDVAVDEDEVEATPSAPARSQKESDYVPIERFNEVRQRADAYAQLLEQFQQRQAQPEAQPRQRVEEDDDQEFLSRYTDDAKNWFKFADPWIERRAKKLIDAKLREIVPRLERDTFLTRDMQDLSEVKRNHKDYGRYESEVNEMRAQWFRENGSQPPPRETFYYYVKGRRMDQEQNQTRTSTARSNAKAGSTVSTRAPVKKVAPKGPLTKADIDAMDDKQLAEAMLKYDVHF